MPTPVKMPRLGESVAEGTVGSWLKQEGDWVEKDESLAEIITDKINAELPSPVAGRLAKILVQADQTVPVGVDIALIEENADVSASAHENTAPPPDAAQIESPFQANVAVMDRQSAGRVNAGDGARATTAPVASASSAVAPAPHLARRGEEERQRISPLARRLAREVISVERYRTLADTARRRLATLGYDNVDVRVGDGLAGVPEAAPYDRIMVTAAAETIPEALLGELADDGVMVLPLGPHAGPQQLVKLTKGEQGIKQEDLIGVRFVPLLPGKAREL